MGDHSQEWRPASEAPVNGSSNYETFVVIKVDYMLEQLMYPTVLERVKICSVESISRKDPNASWGILRDYTSTSDSPVGES